MVTGAADSESLSKLFAAVRALDAGLEHHERWLLNVHQSLICARPHPNRADVGGTPHRHCEFGRWYYSDSASVLEDFPAYGKVGELHEKLHHLARGVLLQREKGKPISEEGYAAFAEGPLRFKLEVRNLQFELMNQLCLFDHLTGAWNRHMMHFKLAQEIERAARGGRPGCIAIMDIDHFKQVNDLQGHSTGDLVLREVVTFCSDVLRKYDILFRYGGEEFLICMPDTEPEEAYGVIERLRSMLAGHHIPLPVGETLQVTASFGLAPIRPGKHLEDIIQEADHALLCAKSRGRNQVCRWDEEG